MKLMKRIKTYYETPLHRVMTVTAVLLFGLNLLAIPTSDDFRYGVNSGLSDIFAREVNQYFTWTGRSVAHLIARIFLSFPKPVFDLCNSICFAYVIWLLNAHGAGDQNRISPSVYAFSAFFVFLTVPLFGQTVLWETGACNYLWTAAILLSFLLVYRKESHEPGNHRRSFCLGMFFAGVAAGWTNENTAGAMILIVLLILIDTFHQNRRIPLWMITGLAGALIGFVLMVTAPGNFIRGQAFTSDNGFAYTFTHNLTDGIRVFAEYPGQIAEWILFGFLIALADRNERKTALGYAFASAAAVYAMVLTHMPLLYDRSMFGSTLLLTAADLILLYSVLQKGVLPALGKSVLAVLSVLSLFRYGYTCADLFYTRHLYGIREAWVKEQREAGNLNPVVPQIGSEFLTSYNPMYGLSDLVVYPSGPDNQAYAELNGLESVVSTAYSKWKTIYEHGDPEYMSITGLSDYISLLQNSEDKLILITCSTLTDGDASLKAAFEPLGISWNGKSNGCFLLYQGSILINTGSESLYLEQNIGGHYIYLSSSDDPELSDITVDQIEYTNDHEGISVVVYDLSSGTVCDSVTWNRDNGSYGVRSYEGS